MLYGIMCTDFMCCLAGLDQFKELLTFGIIMNVDDGCEPTEGEKAAAGGGRKKRPVSDEEWFDAWDHHERRWWLRARRGRESCCGGRAQEKACGWWGVIRTAEIVSVTVSYEVSTRNWNKTARMLCCAVHFFPKIFECSCTKNVTPPLSRRH